MQHYLGLYVAYTTAAIGWLLTMRRIPALWPIEQAQRRHFQRPWREFLLAIIVCIAIVFIGQAYQAGFRLSNAGPWGPVPEALNQVMIFSPVILLLLLRRQGMCTAWLPETRIVQRLLVGMALSLTALFAFHLARLDLGTWMNAVLHIYHPQHVDKAVQVFLEDVTIAVVMCRLTAAIGRPWIAAGVVATLFAAGHIPALLSTGDASIEFVGLILDALLGLFIIRILQRAADIWWFWPIHFTLDMTQFV